MTSVIAQGSALRALLVLRAYVPAACVASLIAIIGFWPTYFGPLLAGTLQTTPVIHVHAAVFVGWLLLVIAQAALAALGNRALHIKLGTFGMVYCLLVVIVGLATAFSQFAVRIHAGRMQDAGDFLFVPLTDLLTFTLFFGAAWLYRRKPEIHKRLVMVGTTIMLVAAVHRITTASGDSLPSALLLLVWLAPICIGMIYDLIKQRIVHFAYVLGVAAIVYLEFFRSRLLDSETRRQLSAWLTTFYL